jgi:hypothetical protein
MLGTYLHKFILPNGHQVFVPSSAGRQAGAMVHANVLRRWRPPHYFYHLRKGGHVAALRTHLHNCIFATLDISGFFDSVTRSKVNRALRSIGLDQRRAWEITQESTVEKTRRKRDFSLPYGFVQSPALASLALDRSALGRCMKVLARSNHVRLSCYVDDIVVSGIEEDAVESSRMTLIEAARLSGFVINAGKSQLPGPKITAFNIALSNGVMTITDERMREFESDILHATPSATEGIIAYVRTVNRLQAAGLVQVALTSPDGAVREAAEQFV